MSYNHMEPQSLNQWRKIVRACRCHGTPNFSNFFL